MNWLNLLEQFVNIVVFPCLGLLALYLVKYIRAKSSDLQTAVENDKADKYIEMFENTLTTCVLATKQTYVESLKNQNLFDAEAQKTAFQKTYDSIMKILSAEAVGYLTELYGDFNAYLVERIEAMVNETK